MTRHIIGLCGLIGSGKGTVADYLETQGYKKINFADAVKDGMAAIFDYPRDMLEGSTFESREWRDIPDPFWSNNMNTEITPRRIMQIFGTECMRDGFHSDVWTDIVRRKIEAAGHDKWVIGDIRFYNERDAVRAMNGEIWRIQKGDMPYWSEIAISDNHNGTHCMKQNESTKDIHESEWRWFDHDSNFDVIIRNDFTKHELYDRVKRHCETNKHAVNPLTMGNK